MPPVKIYWYEGNFARNMTPPAGLTAEEIRGFNAICIGTKGVMGTSGHGNSVSMIPASKNEGYVNPPEVIKRVEGANHYQNWMDAVKGGDPPCSNFSISGPYTEWMLLGAISWRFPNEKLLWDGKNLRFTNNNKANEYIMPYMRKGWELKDITV